MTQEQIERFSDGVRMIMLCQRNKEGRTTNKTDKASKRRISKNKEDFFRILNEFRETKKNSKDILRIYSCVNRRDIRKAIRNFKTEQLEADYYAEDHRNDFYFDIGNRWISCLMQQNARAETLFLIDTDFSTEMLDTGEYCNSVLKHLQEINVEVVTSYPTKNGYHFVTKPFNPNLFDSKFGEIKKDALLLLEY